MARRTDGGRSAGRPHRMFLRSAWSLYEMLTGRQPFKRATTVETFAASLAGEAPALESLGAPPAVARFIGRMMAREPAEHLVGARRRVPSRGGRRRRTCAPASPRSSPRTRLLVTVRLSCLARWRQRSVCFARATVLLRPTERSTSRARTVWSARFAPDGQTIVYSASWDGEPVELSFPPGSAVFGAPAGFSSGGAGFDIRSGEMALLLNPRWILTYLRVGTLARPELAGGAPRELASGVHGADGRLTGVSWRS